MKKKRMIALDADYLIFMCTEGKQVKTGGFSPRRRGGFEAKEKYEEPLKPYKEKMKRLIQDVEDEISANMVGEVKGIKPIFSHPKGNFRYKLAPDYKAGRPPRSELWYRLHAWAIKEYGYEDVITQQKVLDNYILKDGKEKLGVYGKPLYDLYDNMIKRCYRKDSKSKHYKTNGIKVYGKWIKKRKTFFKWCNKNGYKVGLELDRVDGSGNYIPSNCQFISSEDNKRKQHLCDNRRNYIDYKIKYKAHHLKLAGCSMKEICETLEISYGTGKGSEKSKTQMVLEKSFSSDKNLYEYPNEEDWIASKLSENVRFVLKDVEYIVKNGKAELCFIQSSWEADDEVAYLVLKKNWIGASMDKDLWRGIEGDWFNVYHTKRWLTSLSPMEARNFNLIQTLTGDRDDNIKGIHRVGEATAIKLLDKNGWDWNGVVKTYEEKGLTEDDAILARRLICLRQWTPKKGVKLFTPPKH